ncbi:carboxypeptidase-like regulatory domain-containing protein [Mixta calida]|uniref:carboxypeptidase-like regulatory domain-containing protein n=1 Tax=Mixta calida TaxID=665913 RepID=UPI0034D77543
MSELIDISGVLRYPDGRVAGGTQLTIITNSTDFQNVIGSELIITTDRDGHYSFSLLPGRYSVTATFPHKKPQVLGRINIQAGSQAGSLNDFLNYAEGFYSEKIVMNQLKQLSDETLIAHANAARNARLATEHAQSAEGSAKSVEQHAEQVQQASQAAAQHAEQTLQAQQEVLAAEQAAQEAREAARRAAADAGAAAQAETEKLAGQLETDGSAMSGHGATTIANVLDSHGATTSSRGIGFGPDDEPDLTTDHSAALQQMLNTYKYIVFDTIVNCAATVTTGGAGQVITATGIGELRPIGDAMAQRALLALAHQRCCVTAMLITNPLLLKSQSGGRQSAIEIRADDCHVHGTTFLNPCGGVLAPSVYAAAHTKITSNRFLDCLGAGDGDGHDDSWYGEDRGDAVTIWGSSAIIANNHATCKPGEDARIAFHAEYPVSNPTNGREIDGRHTLMIGNYARGPFRRHFVMEGITNGLMIGNVSAGGATWWAEALIQCTNVKTDNQILWDNPGSTAGQRWNPLRGAIGAINFNTNVSINSRVTHINNAAGYGFVIATQTGEHIIDLNILLNGSGAAFATYLLRPKLLKMRCKINNVNAGHKFVGSAGNTGFIPTVIDDCSIVETFSRCVHSDTGGGGRWIARNCEYISSAGDTALALINMDEVTLQNTRIGAAQYAVSLTKPKMLTVTGCRSISDLPLPVRINNSTSGSVGMNDWFFDGNALTVDFRYTAEALLDIQSPLNVKHKWPGRVISTGDAQYVAAGGAPGSGWVPLNGGEKITPAQQEATE